jgi:hypothetical protein
MPITFINATDLTSWADRRDAQGILPQLIRRLIATVDGIERIGFRAGEGVQLGGWDGVVVARAGNAFVPEGASYWELSTQKNVKQKADADYEERLKHSDGIDRKNSTYICVTARRWAGKQEWAAARQAEGAWRSVRAYDADDIETWLESAPAVHGWISIQLGKHPDGIVDIETFWGDWSHTTRPALTAEFVLSGREKIVHQLLEWLRSSSESAAIKAESIDEAVAVVAATMLKLPPEEQVSFSSRALVVYSQSAWDQIVLFGEPLILIPYIDGDGPVARARGAHHRIIVPLGADGA